VNEIHEENPMLGHAGCRLGILYPRSTRCRSRDHARGEAVDEPPHPEIMIPLVDYEEELRILRALVVRIGSEEGLGQGERLHGRTMIELPRACFRRRPASAEHADFFSFGTNDLTQTALGFSRDDVESKFVPSTWSARSSTARRSRRSTSRGSGGSCGLRRGSGASAPGLKLGICGEHGGDPESIEFFHMAGLDYVSCSPYRVPIARVAAAQAAIREESS
jgi:pyruvate,orthophosphate dikinase